MADTKDNRYKNGKIYRLVSSVDDEFYVGSTCTSLAKRLYNHKIDTRRNPMRLVYQHLNKVGLDNVDIVLVEEYACENKMELERRERYWIETLKPTLNRQLPTRTRQEYSKEYREQNKNALAEKKKEYRVQHKEVVAEYQKNYREQNKEVIAKQKKDHYEKNKERYKIIYEQNKDEINARQRERYAQKKAQKNN